jgi:membrane-associated phospholipid phosphatase
MSRDTFMFVLVIVLSFGLTRVAHAAHWSDQTLMGAGLLMIVALLLLYLADEFRNAPRIERRR